MQKSSEIGSRDLTENIRLDYMQSVREQQSQQAPFTHGTCSKLHLHFHNLQGPFTHAQAEETVRKCTLLQVPLQFCTQYALLKSMRSI